MRKTQIIGPLGGCEIGKVWDARPYSQRILSTIAAYLRGDSLAPTVEESKHTRRRRPAGKGRTHHKSEQHG